MARPVSRWKTFQRLCGGVVINFVAGINPTLIMEPFDIPTDFIDKAVGLTLSLGVPGSLEGFPESVFETNFGENGKGEKEVFVRGPGPGVGSVIIKGGFDEVGEVID